ncbi:MAG: class I SAM-dependent methyltransferase [Caulobacter sp.]|nr:class I SAM-dependent methyltransferase [Caulobacter sp.]
MVFDNTAAMPSAWREIDARTRALGFDMPSEAGTGAILRTLAAGKPGGGLLELGTGTGLAAACLLSGMDAATTLVSLDNDAGPQAVARAVLDGDARVTFVLADAHAWLGEQPAASFDLIFADAMPGKYEGLDQALRLLRPGGLYVVDDMSPQPNWPEGHQARVDDLADRLQGHPDLATTTLQWASGLIIAARR